MEKQNIILTKLDLNPHFARGGQGKNKGRQSETTYLIRTVAYLLAKKPILHFGGSYGRKFVSMFKPREIFLFIFK